MKKKRINIVLLHVVHENYYTGIDKYVEMYKTGVLEYEYIYVHTLFFVDNKKILFQNISYQNGLFSAIIPMPLNEILMFQENHFWKSRCWETLTESIAPYIKNMENLIFHSHNTYLIDLADILKKRFGGKVIIHLHCLPWKYSYNKDIEIFNKLYSALLEQDYASFREIEMGHIKYGVADKIVCLSKVAKNYLVNVHQIEEEKIEIIVNGLTSKSPVKRQRNKDSVEILYVGKVSKDKGIIELLEALNEVHNRGYKFKLKIAGTCLKPIEDYIYKKYNMIDLEVLGQISINELQELYSSCTMGIIPSLYEQCSYVALEMAMFGVPMIVSDVDALSEMFTHESTALLVSQIFDPDFGLITDTEMFTTHIIRLIEDKTLRDKLSNNVKSLYLSTYTLDKMIHQTIKLYQELS